MEPSQPINISDGSSCNRVETVADRCARLASYAIERGHAHTLLRHLSEGLNPESKFYYRGGGFFSERLIGEAAWLGEIECVKALEDAGVRLTDQEIFRAIKTPNNEHMVAYFLASQKFDPAGSMTSGRPWGDSIAELSPEPLRNCLKAVSEWERGKLDQQMQFLKPKKKLIFL